MYTRRLTHLHTLPSSQTTPLAQIDREQGSTTAVSDSCVQLYVLPVLCPLLSPFSLPPLGLSKRCSELGGTPSACQVCRSSLLSYALPLSGRAILLLSLSEQVHKVYFVSGLIPLLYLCATLVVSLAGPRALPLLRHLSLSLSLSYLVSMG